jgi:hypothetical protein
VAVKCGDLELKRTPTKSLSRQDASAFTTGVSSGGQSSLVVRITGPGRVMVQERVPLVVLAPV